MREASAVDEKVKQIIGEMKMLGLWTKDSPDWVTEYEKNFGAAGQDFSTWLQFMFLPNCLLEVRNGNGSKKMKQIVLQAKRFLANDIEKGKLLQLLIELDAVI